MVWCAYPAGLPVQEELDASETVLANVGKIGTQSLWCIECPPNYLTVEHSGTADASSNVAVIAVDSPHHEVHSSSQIPCKRVPLGPDFQAEVPKRMFLDDERAVELDSDENSLRWLGQRVWSKQDAVLQEAILMGCERKCSCVIQDTVECVRLHIWEKRELLKVELGAAFYSWGFHEMGEAVAERWSDGEQLAFEELVRKYPSSFWGKLSEHFPTRCMADFISYYFNVCVLRRRAIQNRISPENIDSDDDEMILDSDERDSESTLESNEDNEVESQVDDAASEGMVNIGCMHRSAENDLVHEEAHGNTSVNKSLHDGEEEAAAPSFGAGCTPAGIGSVLKVSPCDYCNEEDKGQHVKVWDLLAWDHKNHATPTRCVMEQNEKDDWSSPSLQAAQDEVDRLISTKGMMEEFFGSEVSKH